MNILPFFIPHLGCPNDCIFCNQKKVAGVSESPKIEEILEEIDNFLLYNKEKQEDFQLEVAFYGGSFTALEQEEQVYFLAPLQKYLENGKITRIRVSTRPDAINEEILDFLEKYRVKTVELGIQSMSDQVLLNSNRGHNKECSINAVRLLQKRHFNVGVQILPGLPGETRESCLRGANEILSLRPNMVRFYPALVIENTKMAEMFKENSYKPLTLDEAQDLCGDLILMADYYNVQVIRVGLQPTEEISYNGSVLAGPFHPAFGDLAENAIWKKKILYYLDKFKNTKEVYVNQRDLSSAIGQKKANKEYFKREFNIAILEDKTKKLELGAIKFGENPSISHYEFVKAYVENLLQSIE